MIVVNATALREGGGLSILNQMVEFISNRDEYFIFFIHPSVNIHLTGNNIKLIRVEKTSFISRIWWDFHGLKSYLKRKKLTPSVVVSLQNTSVRINSDCKQVIYLHNIIPFSDYKWDFFRKKEYIQFVYKYLYRFFIFCYADFGTYYVVQANWFKKILLDKEGINSDKILVSRPYVKKLCIKEKINLDCTKKHIFYPALNFSYKNHIEIVNALIYMRLNKLDYSNLIFYFTLNEDTSNYLLSIIEEYDLSNSFIFLGPLAFDDVQKYYNSVDLIVFPSRLETFGLPLIEAAALGKPIVTVDSAYSREVLGDYRGASFCQVGDSAGWSESILKAINKDHFTPLEVNNNGWLDFYNLLVRLREM
ncbi:glycosyltransferase [Vibrio porteresiae]|uniref:Glycosyltransferase n=1 Tax=Vibrio porteresiae DSM 19223 TaxID=1123496 RepID=A0ABZ0QEF1_9VIBR|nr:glycosyltransferase [Vibrio porteresiae]WPC74250.1 glycosyltransferase [Vibrio porteresiae DSM 19223]